MNKRYQVFVSSTYTDLQEERSKVIQTIMELDCFPAGMELFPAIDDEQFEFIKSVIDDCDYYLLIIGGRYGSIDESGLSYTEKEFDYAIEKGMKVIAFIHGKPDDIPVKKTDQDPELLKKLESFKKKVSTNRLIRYWEEAKELPGLVALSLAKTIRIYPAVGWIRADHAVSPEMMKEVSELRKENENLRKRAYEKAILKKEEDKSKKIGDFNYDDIKSTLTKKAIGGSPAISILASNYHELYGADISNDSNLIQLASLISSFGLAELEYTDYGSFHCELTGNGNKFIALYEIEKAKENA